jgi:hypothetical protein
VDGRGAILFAAAGWARRLRIDASDVVADVDKRGERRQREIGRTHEGEAKRHCSE